MKKFALLSVILAVILLTSCMSAPRKATLSTTDPFENIHISFVGSPDKGYMQTDLSECRDIVKENFRFSCHNDSHLSNGQVAVVTALKIRQNDIQVLRYQKEYIVTGVDFYPEKLEDYEKDDINKSIWKYADDYIKTHILDFPMEYCSRLDRTGWSKSGAFDYHYNYHDIVMLYSVHKTDKAKNTYFIIFDLENNITCTQDMESSYPAPMKKGESDIGQTYVVVGVSGIRATSNKIFKADTPATVYKVFTTQKEAEKFCTYGGEYNTFREMFV